MKQFQILEIVPPRLDLTSDELENTFYRLSMQLHPDRNSASDAAERAADLNEAYRLLREPWSRAALLVGESKNSKIPTELAEIFFEVQESEDPQELKALSLDLAAKSKARGEQLLQTFKKFDQAPFDQKQSVLGEIENLVHENKYAKSMERDLSKRLSKFDL